MQVILVMFRDGGERRSFSLTRDTTIIGRREDCDFRIPLAEISRKHCRLIKEDGALRVEDLGSSNGTYINGVRVQEGTLAPGDTLKVGSIVFVVQIDGVPVDDDLHPVTPAHADLAEGSGATATIDELPPTSTEHHLNPTAQSEVDDHAAAEEQPFIISDDAPAGSPTDSSAAEYDPMAVLSQDPEDSSAGGEVSDDISEDILMDLEAQDRPSPS